MEITKIVQYLIAWCLLLISQSIFINGVYQSATGETKKRVDGSDEDSEMILYWLKKFFEQTKTTLVPYKDLALSNIIQELYNYDKESQILLFDQIEGGVIANTYNNWQRFLKLIPQYQANCRIKIKNNADWRFFIYKEYEDYKYPVWLRKPIIQCIKCMASFWGALTFWPVVLFLFGFNLIEIPIFFADMFSLAYLNWVLYLKAQSK
jgi:hypothetical protein